MKWIKTAIGAVFAIISIGIIATIVYKMTQSSEVIKEVSFEIDWDEELYEGTYYPISIFNEILEYAVIGEYGVITNIVSGYLNNDEMMILILFYKDSSLNPSFKITGYMTSPDGDINLYYEIFYDGEASILGGIEDDVNIKLVFAVPPQPPQLTGISATLILLIPIVFVGGVLLYFYKPFKKD